MFKQEDRLESGGAVRIGDWVRCVEHRLGCCGAEEDPNHYAEDAVGRCLPGMERNVCTLYILLF